MLWEKISIEEIRKSVSVRKKPLRLFMEEIISFMKILAILNID